MSTPSTRVPSGDASSRPESRRELSLVGTAVGATAIVAVFGVLALVMHWLEPHLPHIGPDSDESMAQIADGDVLARIAWFLGDMTEPHFYASWLASVGLLVGAAIAWWAGTRRKRWAGAPISYGSGVWPWILGSSVLSLALSNLAFGWWLTDGWQPTFVPFVCVASSIVLVYGRGWAVLLTGAVMGAVTTTPVAMALIEYVTGPADLPVIVSNTLAMSIGSALTFLVARRLPWMRLPEPAAASAPATTLDGRPTLGEEIVWTVRRVTADFTETQFYATEIASLGVLIGVVASFLLNPDLPVYGSGVLPQVLFAQALTSALGVVLWRHVYRGGGWAPTYISVVSVAPATVIAFGGTAWSIVLGAVAGAVLCPFVARPNSARLPKDFHPFIGNTLSMAVCTGLVVGLANLVV